MHLINIQSVNDVNTRLDVTAYVSDIVVWNESGKKISIFDIANASKCNFLS